MVLVVAPLLVSFTIATSPPTQPVVFAVENTDWLTLPATALLARAVEVCTGCSAASQTSPAALPSIETSNTALPALAAAIHDTTTFAVVPVQLCGTTNSQ